MKQRDRYSRVRQFTDERLLSALLEDDKDAIVYFFYEKFLPTFEYHIYKLFPYQTDVEGLVDEFFLYLRENGWKRLRTFNGSASLSTWISVVSYRYFKDYKHSKIDSNGLVTINSQWESFTGDWVQSHDMGIKMDIESAIGRISNERDRDIARKIFFEDSEYQAIADHYGLSVDYVYTIKNRIVKQLRSDLKSYI